MAELSQQKTSTKNGKASTDFLVYGVLKLVRILSLDVVLGACISSWFVAHICEATVELTTILTLGVCVWLIYTADHLWDAYQLQHPAHTDRHSFHQRYFRSLSIIWLMVAMLSLFLLFGIPPVVLRGGLILSVGVVLYFIINQFTKLDQAVPKEVLAALLYTLGIFLPVIVQADNISMLNYLVFGQFFGLALANLTLISWYESETDRLDGASSLATQYGKPYTQFISKGCILLCLALASGLLFNDSPVAQLTVIAMSITLGSIWMFPAWYAKNERYRWVADGIFLLPALFYPLLA